MYDGPNSNVGRCINGEGIIVGGDDWGLQGGHWRDGASWGMGAFSGGGGGVWKRNVVRASIAGKGVCMNI